MNEVMAEAPEDQFSESPSAASLNDDEVRLLRSRELNQAEDPPAIISTRYVTPAAASGRHHRCRATRVWSRHSFQATSHDSIVTAP